MLAGDAAALVDPLSGEGIWAAFVSARVAAREAVRYLGGQVADLRGYAAALDAEVRDDLIGSRRLQGVFQRLPSFSILMLKYSDAFWRYLVEIIRGDLTYPDLPRKLGPVGRAVEAWGDVEARLHRRQLARPRSA
jgi:flavin-dependent dehydrogenase